MVNDSEAWARLVMEEALGKAYGAMPNAFSSDEASTQVRHAEEALRALAHRLGLSEAGQRDLELHIAATIFHYPILAQLFRSSGAEGKRAMVMTLAIPLMSSYSGKV